MNFTSPCVPIVYYEYTTEKEDYNMVNNLLIVYNLDDNTTINQCINPLYVNKADLWSISLCMCRSSERIKLKNGEEGEEQQLAVFTTNYQVGFEFEN